MIDRIGLSELEDAAGTEFHLTGDGVVGAGGRVAGERTV